MKAIACILGLLASAYIGGCSEKPVAPSPSLRPAPAWAVAPCEDLPDIPELQGDPAVRRPYDAHVRSLYVECAGKHRHMVKRDRIIADKM